MLKFSKFCTLRDKNNFSRPILLITKKTIQTAIEIINIFMFSIHQSTNIYTKFI